MEEDAAGASTPFLQKLNSYLDGGLDPKLRRELEMLRDDLRGIINLFAKAERIANLTDESRSGETLDSWIRSSKKTIYDKEDKLDLIMVHNNYNKKKKIRTSLLPCIGSNKQLTAIGNSRKDLETIMEKGKSIQDLNREDESTTSNLDHDRALQREQVGPHEEAETTTTIVGMYYNYKKLLMKLDFRYSVNAVKVSQYKKFRAISLTGRAGIGKTLLVQKIWNDKKVMRYFDCRAWVAVGFSEPKEILSRMLDGFCYGTTPYAMGTMNEDALVHAIISQLQGKKFLLVLDDVCGHVWSQVRNLIASALPRDSGGRVIITTRNKSLARIGDIPYSSLHFDKLTFHQSYDLFCKIALPSTEATHPQKMVAHAIVKELQGLPIAIAVAANLARTDPDWEKLLACIRPRPTCNPHVNHETVFMLAYNHLSYQSKYVFLYCCLLPEDSEIRVRNMIQLCVAEGFVDNSGRSTAEESVATCLRELIGCSLIQATIGLSGNVETCTVHELVRDVGLTIVKKGMFREFGTWTRDTTIPPQDLRRLSIVGNSSNIPSTADEVAFVHSCFVSNVENVQFSSICQLLLGGHQLLRVLNLRNTKNTVNIVDQLGNLIHLRYLGLRGTDINELPASLSKLRSLQTLDIRDTQVIMLPGTFIRLEKLRHVHLVGSFKRKVVEFPLGRKMLKLIQIQTLAGVRASTRLIEELGSCTQLRKLSIGKVSGHDSNKLCASINNMRFLQSLTIKARGVDKLQMGTLSPDVDWSSLHTLKIGGRIESLSHLVHLVSCFRAISRLHLWDSMLDEDEDEDEHQDPFVCLQRLTNLEVLCLSNAYIGKQMICNAGWFPKLKKLSVLRMRKLEHWWIMQEAMHSLEELFVGYCPNLKEVPQDLDKMSSLQLVQVSEMPQEFTAALQEESKLGPFKVHCVPQFVQVE